MTIVKDELCSKNYKCDVAREKKKNMEKGFEKNTNYIFRSMNFFYTY